MNILPPFRSLFTLLPNFLLLFSASLDLSLATKTSSGFSVREMNTIGFVTCLAGDESLLKGWPWTFVSALGISVVIGIFWVAL